MTQENTFSSGFIGNKTGEIRAMFYNVFGYDKTCDRNASLKTIPKLRRQQIQTQLISEYEPDFIGFQEFSPSFHRDMTSMLADAGYTEVDVCPPDGEGKQCVNYTPIFYRAQKLKLISKGALLYDEVIPHPDGSGRRINVNDQKSKSLTWAIFEVISSKKRFIAANTHFMYDSHELVSLSLADAIRKKNASAMLNALTSIKAEKKANELPIVVGGDLNGNPNEEFFKMLTGNGMKWLYDISPVKDNSCGMHGYTFCNVDTGKIAECSLPADGVEKSIDYIFAMQGKGACKLQVSAYVTVTDEGALFSSDHCPRITDFSLTSNNITERKIL